jgi:hypothetical protein
MIECWGISHSDSGREVSVTRGRECLWDAGVASH